MSEGQFVQRLNAEGAKSNERVDVASPQWEQVAQQLEKLHGGDVCRVDLYGEDESTAMSIHGQGDAFHIAVCANETSYHYFWNGQERTEELREIAGNLFSAHQVCDDFALVLDIAKEFWSTGQCLGSVQWVSEQVDC